MDETISLCMVVRNEEDSLKQCVDSVSGIVDEIIIVDTGSTDSTKEFAKNITSSLFELTWENDFSKARNFSISKAKSSWILCLDADEVISKKDHEKIKNLLNEGADAFLFNLRDYTNNIGSSGFISSEGDIYKESKAAAGFVVAKGLRLFRNKKGYYFEGKIHETIQKSIERSGGKTFDTDIAIHHFGNLKKERNLNRRERNVFLLKQRLKDNDFNEKTEDYVCFELAKELINLNRFDEAIEFLEKAVNISERFEYLLNLGGLYIIKKKLDEAEKVLKKAMLINPSNPSVHSNLGVIYSEKGFYNKAIKKFEKSIQLNKESADAYFNLGLVYKKKGKENKSKEFFEKAIQLNKRYKDKIPG